MIKLRLVNHEYSYELLDIIRMFFGKIDIEIINYEKALVDNQGFLLISEIVKNENKVLCISKLFKDGKYLEHTYEMEKKNIDEKIIKRMIKISMYKLLSKEENKEFPWGILSGIRPVKIVHELLKETLPEKEVIEYLKSNYLIRQDRAELALEIAIRERKFIYPFNKNKVGIYIGIPFCPSKCYYCSFTSNPIKQAGKFVSEYIDALMKEINSFAAFLKAKFIDVESVYLGGGTPTSLDPINLERLIHCINTNFSDTMIEFTCEAGRPDTIDEEKLIILKNGNVTRLSINPQSMNDNTLKAIGRLHNSNQIIESYQLAEKLGFNNINMDIILGLQDENIDDIQNTLNKIIELNPTNITVHTLAIKRASLLHEKGNYSELSKDDEVESMMDLTKRWLQENNMNPYYLYRQKFMMSNLENIGFAKEGYECIYNMQIMEEKQTIIGLGADAATKAVFLEENRIERFHNIKDYKLYISEIDNIIKKKTNFLLELYK